MKETFISYLWFNRLFYERQTTLMGEKVEIVSPGVPNNDAGPDVFNAKIKRDGQLWAGNVEFHVKASDWHLHGHDQDRNYQNIILHVVLEADEQILTNDGRAIPTIELRYPDFIRQSYNELMSKRFGCDSRISRIDKMRLTAWLERLAIERLEAKAANVAGILDRTSNDWDQVLYTLLARALGQNVNGDAMQQLAIALPIRYLRHHIDNITQIEAMLLGTAGLIQRMPSNEIWEREYAFLRAKYGLDEPQTVFRFSKMRPHSFPTHKILELAREVAVLPSVHSLIKQDTLNEDELRKKPLLQLINCYLPCLFLYGATHDNQELKERVVDMMHTLPPEKNFIVRHFQSRGISAHNAAESQALIHLYREYCEKGDCVRCRFAHELMTKKY